MWLSFAFLEAVLKESRAVGEEEIRVQIQDSKRHHSRSEMWTVGVEVRW